MKKLLLAASLICTSFMSHANEKINVGISSEPYPPFSAKNSQGVWEGFEIDLLRKVCEDAALDCQIKEVSWDGIIPALLSKKIDVIFNSLTITEERSKKVLFTTAYYNSLPKVVGLAGQKFEFDKKSLKNKIIGVQGSTISAYYLKDKVGKIVDIREYSEQNDANLDLLSGRVDYMVADGIIATNFYAQHKDVLEDYGDVEYNAILGKGIGAAVRKEDTELEGKLSKSIAHLIHSDFYTDLSMKYFGTNIAPK
ncbi:MAG: transporter substrate-binding domain-containing protein [Marinomonas sp.]